MTWIKDDVVRKNVKKIVSTVGIALAYGSQPRLLTTGLNAKDMN